MTPSRHTVTGIQLALAAFIAVIALLSVARFDSPTVEASGPTTLAATAWEGQRPYGPVNTPAFSPLGAIAFYDYIPAPGVPGATDAGWAPCGPGNVLCPNADTIGLYGPSSSRLGGSFACGASADYTFYQAFVSIPLGTTISEFKVVMSGADDGARVAIHNSAHPGGAVLPGAYIFLGGAQSTTDLSTVMVAGEVNRVVITQMDNCATGNNLQSAQILLNGTVITPTPVAPTLLLPADGSLVSKNGYTVSGTGTPGLWVNLLINGLPNAQIAQVAPDGMWSIPNVIHHLNPPPTGGYDLSAAQSAVPGGTMGPASNVAHVTNYPPAPVILTPGDGTVLPGGFAVSGTGVPGLEVHIQFNGLFNVQFTTVAPDGTWSIGSVQGYEFVANPGFVLTAIQRLGFGEMDSPPSNPVALSLPVACAPGTYSATGNEPCLPAPAGSFVSTTGATAATACAPGTYQPNIGQTSCLPAPAGSFVSTAGATAATACAPGTYQPNMGQTGCVPAPAGSFVSTAGATAATPCAPGTYQPNTGQTGCIPAPAGSFVSTAGATAATPCAPGTYQPNTGQTSCLPAPVDTFVAASGATSATTCPPGTSTGGLTGQTSCSPTYQFPANGVFVIGDRAAQAVGSSVTFWSAQWTASNPTSSAAPNGLAAFKGFAQGANAPACGGTWTANPGNSGNPPSVVPEYMAVVVTSAITRSGPNVRGNVTAILIVKTDPGYGGAPGHRGTGTVVGVLCSS